MDLTPGMEFTMTVDEEFKVKGNLIARYREGMVYRITDLNKGFIAGLISQGKARIGNFGQAKVSTGGRVAGKAVVK